jgi:hypothetical protein
VGANVTTGSTQYEPLLLRMDETGWNAEPLPWDDSTSTILRGIASTREGQPWIAGTRPASGKEESHGILAQQADGAWTSYDILLPDGSASELRSVAVTDLGIIAVGSVGNRPLAVASCDGPSERAQAATGSNRLAMSLKDRPVPPVDFRVRDVAEQVGLAEVGKTWGGLIADFNADGFGDLFYSRHQHDRPRLALGALDGFTDAPVEGFDIIDRHGCAAADVDHDDAMDIFCTTGRVRGSATGRHQLMLRVAELDASAAKDGLGRLRSDLRGADQQGDRDRGWRCQR